MKYTMNKKMKCVCVAVGVVLLACSVWLGRMHSKRFIRVPSYGCSEAMQKARETYARNVNAELDAFPDRVRESARREFASVRGQIPSVVSSYGFWKCLCLTKDLVIDKFNGGDSHRFRDAIDADLSNGFYTPLLAATQKVFDEKADLDRRLEEERKRYLKACALEVKDVDAQAVLSRLEADSLEVEAKLHDLYVAELSSVVSVAAEAALLPSTIAVLRAALVPAVARAGVSVGAGVAVSQLDSPVPGPCDIVGAAIAAGGLVWTAYDVYKATCVLPRELEVVLNQTVDDQGKGTVEALLASTESVRNVRFIAD